MEQYTEPAPTALQPGDSPLPAPGLAQEPLPATPQRREKLQLLWGDLLQANVREPGLILDAYARFHGYRSVWCPANARCETSPAGDRSMDT